MALAFTVHRKRKEFGLISVRIAELLRLVFITICISITDKQQTRAQWDNQ